MLAMVQIPMVSTSTGQAKQQRRTFEGDDIEELVKVFDFVIKNCASFLQCGWA